MEMHRTNGSWPAASIAHAPAWKVLHPLRRYRCPNAIIAARAGTSTGRVNVGKGRMASHVINFESVAVPQPMSEPEKGALHPQMSLPSFIRPNGWASPGSLCSAEPDFQKEAATEGQPCWRSFPVDVSRTANSRHALHAPTETAGLYKDRRETLGAAAALFAQHRIWSAAAMHARFPQLSAGELDMLLQRLAYLFRNGGASLAEANPLHPNSSITLPCIAMPLPVADLGACIALMADLLCLACFPA